jgi:hypothetical protein
MPLLRFIDVSGKEQDIADLNHLYRLITACQFSYDSLVRDEKAGRWVPAREHELFVRIRGVASSQTTMAPTASAVTRPDLGVHETKETKQPTTKWLARVKKWFARIETREDALAAIARSSTILFVFAGLYTVAAAAMVAAPIPRLRPYQIPVALAAPLMFLGLGLWLRYRKSRIAAVLLLILPISAFVSMIALNRFQPFWVAFAIFLYVALKAIEATFKFHRRFKIEPASGVQLDRASP